MQIASQTTVFLLACLAGILLGAVYDLFRFCRVLHRDIKPLVFLEDLLFSLTASAVTFYFQLAFCNGWLRGFVLLGELLGFLLYRFTLGEITIRLFRLAVQMVMAVLRWLWKWLLRPPLYLLVRILNKIYRIILRIIQKCLKLPRNKKFRLPHAFQMMYNKHNKSVYIGKEGETDR